jgi:hypothetical protein
MAERWYQDDDGATSLGRIGVAVGVAVGGFLAFAGGVLVIIEVLMQAKVTGGAALAGIGSGLIGTSLACKSWQRQAEAKIAVGQ